MSKQVVLVAVLLCCALSWHGGARAQQQQYESYHDLDVFELVRGGDTELLSHLLAMGESPNRRTGEGKTLLYVASELGQAHVASLLLQAGAKIDGRESHTGNSSLLASVLAEDAQVAELLLAYGANPDTTNKLGVSPRSLGREKGSASENIASLFARYDDKGPMAFEDAPGTWRVFAEGDRNYYQNALTQESQWSIPPSCGWTRHAKEGGLYVYSNKVTGQVTWITPSALSWKFILHKEQERPMWLNVRTQRLQLEVPGELPNAMVGELMDEANTFWFNENTGEMRWDRPEEVGWKQISDERGATFWFNQVTGAAQWEDPVDISWKEEESAKRKGEKYYWNEYTGEATFGKPEPLAWSMKKEL